MLLINYIMKILILFQFIDRENFFENNNNYINGLSHTYQDKYFKDMDYISDLRRKRSFPSIKKYLNNKNRKGLQLLLHPIWWHSIALNSTATINNWLLENNSIFIDEIRKNSKTYVD